MERNGSPNRQFSWTAVNQSCRNLSGLVPDHGLNNNWEEGIILYCVIVTMATKGAVTFVTGTGLNLVLKRGSEVINSICRT